jgi:hypothetical protein
VITARTTVTRAMGTTLDTVGPTLNIKSIGGSRLFRDWRARTVDYGWRPNPSSSWPVTKCGSSSGSCAANGPVTAFDELHERRMHLIVLRRDLTGFQHLHPEMDEAGTWRTSLRLPSAGAWRAFADFSTEGAPTTLGVDILVEGEFRPERLPEPSTTAQAGDHVVSLQHDDAASLLRFAVKRDGAPVKVAPYLGAMGHLVAVR